MLKKGAEPQDKNDFMVDQDMIEAASVMVGYVRQRQVELGADLQAESYTIPLTDRDDSGGTADVTLDAWPDVLEVVDYKHGAGVYVPVLRNFQTRSYLLGKAIESGFSHDIYRHSIVQPRCSEAPDIASEEMTRAELLEFQKGLVEAAERVDCARDMVGAGCSLADLKDAGYLTTGEDGSACTWCELKRGDVCPAARAMVESMANMDFQDEPLDLPIPDGSDPELLARILLWVPFLDKWIKRVKEGSLELVMSGTAIPGYKLVRGRSNRCWVDLIDGKPVTDADLIKKLTASFDIKRKDLLTEPGLKSGPQVEKLLDKDDRKVFEAHFLRKPPGRFALTDADDKRDEVVPAAQDFSDFDDFDDGDE
jgi:hypothetical protein